MQDCELCVVGAGYAALNGLNVAAKYLKKVHRGHLVDVDGTRMVVRNGKDLREAPVADGSLFVNCTSHFRQFPHRPILSDDGLVCAPQFAMGFSGTSAYYVAHLWYRDELGPIAPKLFRIRVDVDPKLRFLGEVGLVVMANMAMAGARLPFSIPSSFLGDFNKWYPIHRQIPTLARIIATRAKIIRRAERVLRMRYSDRPDAA